MPKVLNKKLHGVPQGAVYIGRPSKLGNPYVIGRDGTREQVIAKFDALVDRRPDLQTEIEKCRGADVVCWCWPEPCHGDVVIRRANEPRS